jgi:hypothetical protein
VNTHAALNARLALRPIGFKLLACEAFRWERGQLRSQLLQLRPRVFAARVGWRGGARYERRHNPSRKMLNQPRLVERRQPIGKLLHLIK